MQLFATAQNDTSSSRQTRSESHLASLDGARALSILLVLIDHGISAVSNSTAAEKYTFLPNLGHIGVSTFFVISGLLITWLLIKERDATGSVSLSNFYIRRALRILPVYYLLILTVSILKELGYISIGWLDIFSALSFTHNYYTHLVPNGAQVWWLGHTWSLCIEEQFYLVWPSLFVFLPRRFSPRLAVALAFAGPLLRLMNYYFLPTFRGAENDVFQTRIDILMVGCAAAFLLNSPRWRVRIHAIPVWPTLILTTLFLCALEPVLSSLSVNHLLLVNLLRLTMPTVEGLVIAASLLVLIAGKHGGAFWIFNYPVMNHFGRLSYSLYIWQQLFLAPGSAKGLVALTVKMALIYLVALCSYHFLEQPFLKLRSRLRRGVAV